MKPIRTALLTLALLFVLSIPAHAAPAAYTCRWTTNWGVTPPTGIMRCTNGYARAYTWSARLGRWIPVATTPAAAR